MIKRAVQIAVVISTVFFSGALFAQTAAQPEQFVPQQRRPRYELGAAAGFFYLPDYPGADESRLRILPIPYFIYRGDFVRAEREGGVRGRFYMRESFELDLSFDAAFPVNSTKNKAREGMENLDWIGQVGPRFIYHVFKNPESRLDFYLPLRVVASSDFTRIDDRGVVLQPEFAYRHRDVFHAGIGIAAYTGITYASERLMDYFYTIKPRYAKAGRSAYEASGGELASNVSFFLVKELPYKVTVFAGNSYYFYSDAKNRTSPLIRDRDTVSYSLGIVWRFFESEDKEGNPDASLSPN